MAGDAVILVTWMTAILVCVVTARSDQILPPLASSGEFCESETFHAKCWTNEVISMTSAQYGRMHIGRCVEADLGYLGCEANVLNITDRKCSGKRECEIRIPDGDLDKTKPCFKELKVFLEATYKCVRVIGSDYNSCTTPVLVTQDTHHLLGDPGNPATKCTFWRLEAQPGQRINLTLIDYSWEPDTNRHKSNQFHQKCINYGKILDKSAKKNTTICGGGPLREQHLMVSPNHSIQIELPKTVGTRRFLIQYHAVGCPDLRKPKDAWLQRNDTKATVGCIATRQTWHLTCNGKTWVGVIGNCTQHLVSAQREAQTSASTAYIPHGVAIVLIVGIAVIICVVIVSIGFACIRSRYNKKLCAKRKDQIRYNNVRTDDDTYKAHKDDVMTISHKTPQTGPIDAHKYTKKNDYSHIWELPLPDPKQQDGITLDGSYRGIRSNTDSAYGMSLHSNMRSANEENYHVSQSSRTTDDSRYFVLDRDPVPTIPDDPEC